MFNSNAADQLYHLRQVLTRLIQFNVQRGSKGNTGKMLKSLFKTKHDEYVMRIYLRLMKANERIRKAV